MIDGSYEISEELTRPSPSAWIELTHAVVLPRLLGERHLLDVGGEGRDQSQRQADGHHEDQVGRMREESRIV